MTNTAKVKINQTGEIIEVPIISKEDFVIPTIIQTRWKSLLEIANTVLGNEGSIGIYRIFKDNISVEAVIYSGKKMFLKEKEHVSIPFGLFTESAIGLNSPYEVIDYKKDRNIINSDLHKAYNDKRNVTSSYSLPLKCSSGEFFGALTFLNNEPKQLNKKEKEMLDKVRESILQDIEQVIYNTQLLNELNFDFTSKAYSRRGIMNILEDITTGQSMYALALIDIDDFKNINDKYGHTIGDKTLELVSEYFKKTLPNNEAIGRWGGDEFILISKDSTAEEFGKRLKLLLPKMVKSIRTSVPEMGVSVGIADILDGDGSFEDVIKKADKAMYHIKLFGKGASITYRNMLLEIKDQDSLDLSWYKKIIKEQKAFAKELQQSIVWKDIKYNVIDLNHTEELPICDQLGEQISIRCYRNYREGKECCKECFDLISQDDKRQTSTLSPIIDGKRHYYEIKSITATNETNKKIGYINVIEDITEKEERRIRLEKEKEIGELINQIQNILFDRGPIFERIDACMELTSEKLFLTHTYFFSLNYNEKALELISTYPKNDFDLYNKDPILYDELSIFFNDIIKGEMIVSNINEVEKKIANVELLKIINNIKSKGTKWLISFPIKYELSKSYVFFLESNQTDIDIEKYQILFNSFSKVFKTIIERSEYENRLLVINNQLNDLFRLTNSAMFEMDFNRNIISIGESSKYSMNYENMEEIKIDYFLNKVAHPDYINEMKKLVSEIASGDKESFDFIWLGKKLGQKDYIWLHTECSVLDRNEDGTVRKVIGVNSIVKENKLLEIEREKKSKEFQIIAKQTGVYMCSIDANTGELYVPDYFFQRLQIEPFKINMFYPQDNYYREGIMYSSNSKPITLESFDNLLEGAFLNSEFLYKLPDGRQLWFESKMYVSTRNEKGKIETIKGLLVDITERKTLQEGILSMEDTFATILSMASVYWFYFNLSEKTVKFDNKIEALLGIEIGIKNFDKIMHKFIYEADWEIFNEFVDSFEDDDIFENTSEFRMIKSDGSPFWVSIRASKSYVSDDKIISGIFMDINEDKRLQLEEAHKNEYERTHDIKTGTYKYNVVQSYLEEMEETDSQIPLHARSVNIHDFKRINKTYGRNAGDIILRAVADKLKESDSMVTRTSGDEFFVVTESDMSPEKAFEMYSNNDNNNTSFEVEFEGISIPIELTVSYVNYPKDTLNPTELIEMSQSVINYLSEEDRRQVVAYDGNTYERYNKQMQLLNEIVNTDIERDFEMYYQPIYDIKENEVIFYEALLRWNHPEGGMINAGEFIEIIEKSRQIVSISRSVFHGICNRIEQWSDLQGERISVSFNLSAVSLKIENEATFFIRLIKEVDINPEQIIIEITEELINSTNENVIKNIQAFRDAGVRIALDDFNADRENLKALQTKYDIVKISNAFADNIDYEVSRNVLKLLYDLTSKTDNICVIQGIEYEEQLNILKDLGLSYGQGYYFARPASHAVITAQLANQ